VFRNYICKTPIHYAIRIRVQLWWFHNGAAKSLSRINTSLEYTAWHHVVYLQSKYTQAPITNVIVTAGNYCLTNIEIDCPGRKNSCLFFENILFTTYN